METKIKKALLYNPSIGIDVKNITVTSLLGGKESSIYKVTNQNDKCVVVKIPKTDWQKREIHVFRDYLSKLDISTPRFLGEYNNEVLIIEFLEDCKTLNKLSLSELKLLREWIINKHSKSCKLFTNESRSLLKHAEWMVNHPIKQILSNKSIESDVKGKLLELQPNLLKALDKIDLPMVLDHSDLEIQNLLFDTKKEDVCVLDWANAIKSPGFYDIAQFRKLARQYVSNDADSLVSELMKEVGLADNNDLLETFALIKEINLLSYYLKERGVEKDNKSEIDYARNIITEYEEQN